MGNQDNGKVIPFAKRSADPTADAATDNTSVYMPRGHSLAERRGLETIDPTPPERVELKAAERATPSALNAAQLSELFITSLDDMIREAEDERVVAARWPEARDEHLEHVALEIISMLYGFVLDDAELPQGAKSALDRLQLPILHLAMRDLAFFADWRHPARRLLDALPRLYRSYHHRGGSSSTFESGFSAMLDELLEALQPNTAAFAHLVGRLQDFSEGAPFAEGSNDTDAWERAEAAARQALERGLPELVRDFLADHWIDVLQRTAVAHGEGSPLWHDAIAVIDDLAWSLAPKADQNERFQLIAEIPSLLTRINRGLDLADIPGEVRRAFFDAIAAVHTELLRVDVPEPVRHVSARESALAQVHRMQRGDWVEFYMSDGSHSRNRLTWISPQRGILVFGNQRGERAIQLAPDDLAELVRSRRAMIVFDHLDVSSDRHSA